MADKLDFLFSKETSVPRRKPGSKRKEPRFRRKRLVKAPSQAEIEARISAISSECDALKTKVARLQKQVAKFSEAKKLLKSAQKEEAKAFKILGL